MGRILSIIMLLLFAGINILFAQDNGSGKGEGQAQVMLFGVFHFNYPNLDIIQVDKKDQLDVTTPENQREIEKITRNLATFKPNKIAVEIMVSEQARIDSLYQAYLNGHFELRKGEAFQIGFRLAKKLGHERVYCIDTWGNMEAFTKPGASGFEVRDDLKLHMEKFWAYQDSVIKTRVRNEASQKKEKPCTLYKVLKQMNQPESIRQDHENYFREAFNYEEKPYDYTGVDWYSASWYNRNLRIFRNLQRITDNPGDKILVIYGAGHLPLLQHAVQSSPYHTLVPAYKLLR
jgi:hypothetical protein